MRQDLSSPMEQSNLQESGVEADLSQHKTVCLEMGYEEDDIKKAIRELFDRGVEKPSLENIIDIIDKRVEKDAINGHSSNATESLKEENRRLKNFLYCIKCQKNNKSALFLPCTHHVLCMKCAEPLDKCPVCQREIRVKYRSFMA